MNFLGGDSFSFVAMRPEGLDSIMENISAVLAPYLPGLDPAAHVAALLAIGAGDCIKITIEAQTAEGRAALQRLALGEAAG